MDARDLIGFCEASRAALVGARVQRIVCVVHGLLFDLQAGGQRLELGLLAVPGVARVYRSGADVRRHVHEALRDAAPRIVAPLTKTPARWPPDATGLDALRAWLLRPAAQPPDWQQLDGTFLRGLRSQAHDRRLWLEFERRDALDRDSRLVLVAELFDRGANFILRDDAGAEIANWKGRRPAPEPRTPNEQTPDAKGPAPLGADAVTGTALGLPWEITPTLHDLAAASARDLISTFSHTQRRRERRLRTKLKHLEDDARRADEAQTLRRMGETLTANLHRVRRGEARITLDDPYDTSRSLDIELDPRLSPQENIALLFKRARRGERGRETITLRLEEVRRDLKQCAEAAAAQSATDDWPAAWGTAFDAWSAGLSEALVRADRDTLWSPGGPRWERPPEPKTDTRNSARPEGPGRCFVLTGSWEVRVGRSNAENDELTHRFAHPDDVWLHASGVPGSHVVLRMKGLRDNPPRDVLEAAAAIAARFSRAKHARTVPVIWTRKRYVRKPRKSKPGLATCTHEKTVFVRPGLPTGEDEPQT